MFFRVDLVSFKGGYNVFKCGFCVIYLRVEVMFTMEIFI